MAKRKLWKFHGGLHLDENKTLSSGESVSDISLPKTLVVPVQQHIGRPAEVLVSAGDFVGKGQMLAQASEYVSAAIHAPTSGTISCIEERPVPHPSGLNALCVVIESDGEDQWVEGLPVKQDDYHQLSDIELRNLIRDAGVVGLGGAAFPTAVKLNTTDKHVNTLVINGAECEPYITCDDRLMREQAAEILQGIAIVQHMIKPAETLIGIEDNKAKAICALQEALQENPLLNTHVVAVPTIYPTGGEKQLIKVLTGKEVPSMGLPISIGVICQNVGTMHAVYKAIIEGEPLIERFLTVTGDSVKEPRNFRVRIGTSIGHITEAAGGYTADIERLIMGGPMMGFALESDELPVLKSTNCILCASSSLAPEPKETMPCIRCGECMKVCPAVLLPQQLYWYSRSRDFDKAQDYNLFDCIECGCCAQVCPSQLPLVQYYRFAKTEIWQQERERTKADRARERHEFRTERLDKAAREKAERLAKKKAALEKKKSSEAAKKTDSDGGEAEVDPKKAAIQAAMDRVKAKKAAQAAANNAKSGD